MRRPILFVQGAGHKHEPLGSGKLIAYLQEQLGSDYRVLAPDMPDPDHPRYLAWRDQIEQDLGKLDAAVLLIGHSLVLQREFIVLPQGVRGGVYDARDRRRSYAVASSSGFPVPTGARSGVWAGRCISVTALVAALTPAPFPPHRHCSRTRKKWARIHSVM